MAATGLVVLSADDADAPAIGCRCTVSKDEPFDDGGYQLGVAAARAGVLWCDRPYATGNPSVEWALTRIDAAVTDGASAVQLLNEVNLEEEGFEGGSLGYETYYWRVQGARPNARVLYAPMSPGVAGWQDWVARDAAAYGVHAYGSAQQMIDVVGWYLAATSGEVWVTECNPGAGRVFDLAAWSETELRSFLAWCNEQPRVRAVAYFAWCWDRSPGLPTSVDAQGCPEVVAVLEAGNAPGQDDPPAPFDVQGAQDTVWAIAEAAEAGGYPWLGQAWKAATALSKGER